MMKYVIYICGIETSNLLFMSLVVRLIIYEIDSLVVRFIFFIIETYNL
jgi:hypothetical protein